MRLAALCLGLWSCLARQSAPSAAVTPPPASSEGRPPAPAAASTAVTEAPEPSEGAEPSAGCSSRAEDATRVAATFERVVDEPVTSLALGRSNRAAVISQNRARLFDGKRWILLEPALPAAGLEIYFGRDNEPRVMGYALRENGQPSPVYLRCRNHRCKSAPDELGRLGGAPGALYGVLGFDDPEVVCSAGQICLIKRVSGWKSVPAHAAPARVQLSSGAAFALHSDRVERLTESGFVPLDPARAHHEPRAVWSEPGGVIWLLDRAGSTLARRVGEQWLEAPSPVKSARALWGSASDDVWLVGDGGVAHFDGERWSCVTTARGSLAVVAGNGEHVWLAGQSGVFRAQRVRSPRTAE